MGTTYKQIGYGSKGNEVRELQNRLNQRGYNLTVDGDFGSKTLEAVKQYQKSNGLAVDGIVGKNTWGALTAGNGNKSASTNTNTTSTNANTTAPKDYGTYTPSNTVKEAEKARDDLKAPDAYQSQWNDQIQATIDKILNREKFSYDLNGDALYAQYADKFKQQGKMAMMDTMGQAAAMTGGYGNSYAATAGNQAYQAHLSELNDIVPELYQMAYEKYRNEGQDLVDQYSLLSAQDQQDYGKHRDQVSDYYTDRGYLTDRADTEYSKDYGKFVDDRNLAYQQDRDKASDEKWQKEFDLALEKWNLENGDSSSYSGGNGGNDAPKTGGGNDQVVDSSGIPDSIRNKAKEFESNTALANWLDGLEATNAITPDQADALFAEYADTNEKYVENDDGTVSDTVSYKKMIGSTSGWKVESDGGGNLIGIDSNAKVKTPNGEIMTLKNLKAKLKAEGMSDSEATKAIKKLQQNLGISSNWLFGL